MAATITEGVLWELQADDSQLVAAYRRAESASDRAASVAAQAAKKSEAAYEGLKRKVDAAGAATTRSMQLTRQQALTLQYTLNDITASLASGASPFTILLQQSGQVTQAFGGLRGTAAALGPVIARAALSPVGAVVALSSAVLAVKAAGDAATESLATLAEESRQTGLTPNRVTGAQIVGARAGLSSEQAVVAFANAQKQFEAFSRNSGAVKDILEKVDKGFLRVADSARSSSEWIDRIIQKIRELPSGQGLNLSKALFGEEAGRKLFEEIQNGSVSMAALSREAGKAGANFDQSATHAERMKREIAEANQIASTKLLSVFGDLAQPSLAIEKAWANTKIHIADAVKSVRDLIDAPAIRRAAQSREGALAGAEIGRLVTGKDPFAGKKFSDVDPLINLFTQAQKPSTVGEDRKLFESAGGAAKPHKVAADSVKNYIESLRAAEEKSKADIDNWRLGNVERQKAVALAELESRARKEGRAATQAERDAAVAYAANIGANQDRLEQLTETQQKLNAAAREFSDTLINGLEEIALRGKNAKEALADMAKQLASSALRTGLNNILLGDTGGKSQRGGLLGGLLSGLLGGGGKGLFSGAPFKFDFSAFSGFFAEGGSIPAGKWGILGEKGPEPVFGPATVVPFGKMGGAPNIAVHNYAAGVEVTPQMTPQGVAIMIRSAITQNNAQIPGMLAAAEKRSA